IFYNYHFYQWVMCFDLMFFGVNIICFLYVLHDLIMKKHKKNRHKCR
ncbi:hypothetical protein C6J39_003208, partial [Salmonella enterica subsp. enterica serovar Arechavaleta]|nr:hypothetical protein [Salmonella enterica subsp. enterica serovar Arechavaleta]